MKEKLVGNLDYDLIRNSKTELTEKELKYCENDCLVIYEYIKKELENISMTVVLDLGCVLRIIMNQNM